MKKTFTALALLTALSGILPSSAETSPLSTTLTLGYDSRYVLYGYRLSRHLYHADAYLYRPIDDKTSAWGGAWYGYLPDGTYHEVDVYGGVDRLLTDTLSAGLAYSLFNYIEVPFPTDDRESEFAAHLSYAGGPLSMSLRGQYDTGAKGTLARAIAGWSQPLCSAVSLNLGAEAGYAFEYYIEGNLWNHAEASLETPWQATDALVVTPFLSRSIPLAAIDGFEQYETLYGLSASYSF